MSQSSCDRDPVKAVRIIPSAYDPYSLRVTIELAEHVAACCLNPDLAFVQFHREGVHISAHFGLEEGRPNHRLSALINIPGPGSYSFSITANIMGRALSQEGLYDAGKLLDPGSVQHGF